MNDELLDRALGSLIGVAAGDAMGMPTSFYTPDEIRRRFGRVSAFLPAPADHIFHAGLPAASVTDDTWQTLCVARALIRCRRVDPEEIVGEISVWVDGVGGPDSAAVGPSTRRAIERIRTGSPIEEAGLDGVTNGAAMRISPVGVVHGCRRSPVPEVVREARLATFPTHNTAPGLAAAAAVAAAVAAGFRRGATLEGMVREAVEAAHQGSALAREVMGPSVAERIRLAADIGRAARSVDEGSRRLYDVIGAGEHAAEAVPVAFGVLVLSRADPVEAVRTAANLGGDCDTVASIVGALAGTLRGARSLPYRWEAEIERVNRLELRSVARQLVSVAERWGESRGRRD